MKGMTITSEVIMAIGMITLAAIFSLVSAEIISGQQSGIFGDAQNRMTQELSDSIETMEGLEGGTQLTYTPPVDFYTLEESSNGFALRISGEDTETYSFQSLKVEIDDTIEDADHLCLTREGTDLRIAAGSCDTFDTSDICEDGCSTTICQPELGEDCTNTACTYPENADSEASQYCDPSYSPDYIDEGEPTTEMEWVDQDYTDQGKGDRCEKDFECGTSGGEELECNSATSSGPSGSYCCPSGEKWDGSSCEEVNEIKLVFVPLNENSDDYDDAVSSQSGFFIEQFPVESEDVEVTKVSDVCNLEYDYCSNQGQVLRDVENCAESAGHTDYMFAIGVFQNNVCGTTAGWSHPSVDSAVVETSSKVITAHEIGHQYGLNDEYLDVCRYGDDYGDSGDTILLDEDANCLQTDLDGARGRDPSNPSNMVSDSPFCAGGTESPFDYLSDEDAYSAWCEGNQNSKGGRDIMSYAGAPGPREFAEPAMEHLREQEDFS